MTLAPCQTFTQTVNISGGLPGDVIDFKFLLINGNIDIFDWCCHTMHSITLPECAIECPQFLDYQIFCDGDIDGDGAIDHVINWFFNGIPGTAVFSSPDATLSPATVPTGSGTQSTWVTNPTNNPISIVVELYDVNGVLCNDFQIQIFLPPCDEGCPLFQDYSISCLDDGDGDGDVDHIIEWYFDGTPGTAIINSPDATISPTSIPTGTGLETTWMFNPTSNPVTLIVQLFDSTGNFCEEFALQIQYAPCPTLTDIPTNVLELSPNPATNHIGIDISTEQQGQLQLILYDWNGQQQQLKYLPPQTQHAQFNISDLPVGLYMLQLRNEQGAVEQVRFLKME